ncbi:hypothetical protein Ahy_B04g070206 isoform A [Arachis hypogaea]|uniref:Protein FAR1-RELATED SEQUENCE n=1 Tax=Arachis hypogaea TaxID=3818 RepID=A0A444ZFL5_ARAHY|nr:hypothetical protein Ahy_B04g070206 isoform A [Arachis hypogaea]
MMNEQNKFEKDFGDEFTEGAYFSESDPSEDTLEAAYGLAFDFYLKYSKSKGFSARMIKTFKNSIGEIYKQNFVCHRQGFREKKYYTMEKNETIDTYIWLLRQLMFAMKGKTLTLIITDGAMAIRNAVRDVFPEVRHRLYAWHLIRNATSNVGNPAFTYKFRKIMLGDYEIPVFKRKWVQLIEEFGLEDKPWVNNMYEEKHMWATAYIRGKFFAGFRTTSRCQVLHSVVARYVGSQYDLISFVEHFQRCVSHLRFKEFNADYESTHAVPVMQTCIELLERFAAEVYTHEIFLLIWSFLSRAGSMRVLNIENNNDCSKYIVCKHGRPDFLWTIEFHQEEMIFMCSCLRMELFGIPCEHIVKVLVDRHICEIPPSLVLDRWTKKVKSALNDASGFTRVL